MDVKYIFVFCVFLIGRRDGGRVPERFHQLIAIFQFLSIANFFQRFRRFGEHASSFAWQAQQRCR